jgi:hypothetical protein
MIEDPFLPLLVKYGDSLREIAQEAKKDGFTVCFALSYTDPMESREGDVTSGFDYGGFGDHYACLGLAVRLSDEMRDAFRS